MLARIALMALVLSPLPALAFDSTRLGQLGSVALDMEELAAVIRQSPALKREIEDALDKINKKPGEVMCDGMRFPGPWKGVSGRRVSPYRCQLGDRWLRITTTIRVTGKGGKIIETMDKTAMRKAVHVEETEPKWVWSETKPTQP